MIQDIRLETVIKGRDVIIEGRFSKYPPTPPTPFKSERWFVVFQAYYAEHPYEIVDDEDMPSEEALADIAAKEAA